MTRIFLLLAIATSLAIGMTVVRHEQVRACGEAGPYDFDTFEVENYVAGYATAIELATAGKALTSTYPVGSEVIDVRYQGLKSGPRVSRSAENTSLRVPPTVYKSIAWVESNWANGMASVPYGGVGPTLRADDCGYGLGQVTSGMSNTTGVPTAKQAAIGTHYLVNLAEGMRIFAEKWNSAPKFRPIAGTGNPAIIEDWYFAIWSYNGFAYSNHPLNPLRDPLRGGGQSPMYHCQDPAAASFQGNNGVPKFGYGDYTYPERVYGCMQYPPATKLPGASVATRLYAKQDVNMPDFTIEQIAKAFEVKNFTDCEMAGFSGGCPAMDFPTALPDKKITPHADNTPAVDPAKAAAILGAPVLAYTGPSAANFTVLANGSVNSVQVVVENIGSGVGPFRIRSSAPWIVARHAGDGEGRTLDGGVTVGSEIQVVTQSPRVDRPRLAVPGYKSAVNITVVPTLMPAGNSTGTLFIEPLLGPGAAFTLSITAFRPEIISTPTATRTATATSTATAPGASGTPTKTSTPSPTPIPTPTPDPYPFKAVAANLGKDE